MLQPITIAQITEKFEKENHTPLLNPSDYVALKIDIDKASGQSIGLNTLKRLMGNIAGVENPRPSTLDMIAKYLGYNFWGQYLNAYNLEDIAYTKATKCFVDKPTKPIEFATSQLLVDVADKPPVLYLKDHKYIEDIYERKWPLYIKQFKQYDDIFYENWESEKEKALEQFNRRLKAESKTYSLIAETLVVNRTRKKMLSFIAITTGLATIALGFFRPDQAIGMAVVMLCAILAFIHQWLSFNHHTYNLERWNSIVCNYYDAIKEVQKTGTVIFPLT